MEQDKAQNKIKSLDDFTESGLVAVSEDEFREYYNDDVESMRRKIFDEKDADFSIALCLMSRIYDYAKSIDKTAEFMDGLIGIIKNRLKEE